VVRRAFELAAERKTDREVAAATGLPLFTVRGALTSPLYVSCLRTGERAHWAPVVDPALWETVQAVRATRRTRDGRPALTPVGLSRCRRSGGGDRSRGRGEASRRRQTSALALERPR
jgi:hypothetical protein